MGVVGGNGLEITSIWETGIDQDVGSSRLTLQYRDQAVRFVVDYAGIEVGEIGDTSDGYIRRGSIQTLAVGRWRQAHQLPPRFFRPPL